MQFEHQKQDPRGAEPSLAQQLAALAADFKAAAAAREAMQAQIAATLEKLDSTTVDAEASAQAATQLRCNLADLRAKLSAPQPSAASSVCNAVQDTAMQLLTTANAAAQHIKLLEISLQDMEEQLQDSTEARSAQQEHITALQHELAAERSAHVLTSAREEQVTAALLADQQHLSSTLSALTSAQQDLASSRAEVACLHGQLQAAHKAANQSQAKAAAANASLQQQLASAHAQLQHQCKATAMAQASAAGKTFACARLTAQLNSLRTQLSQAEQQHQAAAEASASTVTTLAHGLSQLVSQQDAALHALGAEHAQHHETQVRLTATQQDLDTCRAALNACQTQLGSTTKALAQQEDCASATVAQLQQKLDVTTQRMQVNREAAARAFAAAGASQFAAARTAAKHSSLTQRLEQVCLQRDAAAAFVEDLSTQLQQAKSAKATAWRALSAERKQHKNVAAMLSQAWDQLDSSIVDAADLQQQLNAAQAQHSMDAAASADRVAALQQLLLETQSDGDAVQHKLQETAMRMESEINSLHAQLTAALRQRSKTAGDEAHRVSALKHALQQTSAERTTAQQQLQLAKNDLASAQQQLQAATEHATELEQELASCRKIMRNHRRTAANAEVVTAALQELLDDSKLQLQQQEQAASAERAQLQQQLYAALSDVSALHQQVEQFAHKATEAAKPSGTTAHQRVTAGCLDVASEADCDSYPAVQPMLTPTSKPQQAAAPKVSAFTPTADLPASAVEIAEQLASVAASSAAALRRMLQDGSVGSASNTHSSAGAAVGLSEGCKLQPPSTPDSNAQHSHSDYSPATPRRTVSWGSGFSRALAALHLSKQWGSGISSLLSDRSSEGGLTNSTSSTGTSSRDNSGGGCSNSVQHAERAVGGVVCGGKKVVDVCGSGSDDMDVFYDVVEDGGVWC